MLHCQNVFFFFLDKELEKRVGLDLKEPLCSFV